MNYELIKVCGMREADNIRRVEALGVDWLGFIFAPRSSRYVSTKPTYLPTQAKRVGVFVDEDLDTVRRIATDYALDIIQLHGHESPDYAARLHEWTVMKVFSVSTATDLEPTSRYEGVAKYFLFDTKGPLAGGNGKQFDWTVLDHYRGQTPFLLSGGIGPDDAARVQAFHHPQCIGIDLNSRFELAPALKDTITLQTFIKTIRHEQD